MRAWAVPLRHPALPCARRSARCFAAPRACGLIDAVRRHLLLLLEIARRGAWHAATSRAALCVCARVCAYVRTCVHACVSMGARLSVCSCVRVCVARAAECFNEACSWDMDDCGEPGCADGCRPHSLGDHECDAQCNNLVRRRLNIAHL
eukprot:630271-Pleurochrysis_carterae.AAC.3